MSSSGALTMTAVGVGMNAAKVLKEKKDPFPTLIAGAFLAFTFSLIADGNSRIGDALAGLFLFGSFLTSGADLIETVASLVNSK